MVHGFKIENDKLILDVEEILQYPLLQQIYARDDSKDKSFAESGAVSRTVILINSLASNASFNCLIKLSFIPFLPI